MKNGEKGNNKISIHDANIRTLKYFESLEAAAKLFHCQHTHFVVALI